MARAAPLALLVLAAAAAPRGARAAFTWEACDADAAPFKAIDVALAPDPPVIGGSVAFTIKATAGARGGGGGALPRRARQRMLGAGAAACRRARSLARGCTRAAAGGGTAPRPPGPPPPPPPPPRVAPDRDVASGSISMSVAFAGVPIFEGNDDLCAKTACPVAPGGIDIVYTQDLPPIAPPVRGRGGALRALPRCRLLRARARGVGGQPLPLLPPPPPRCDPAPPPHRPPHPPPPQGDYDVTLRTRDAGGAELLCVTVHFSMVPPSAAQPARSGGGGASGGGGGAARRGSGGGLVLGAGGDGSRVLPSRRLLDA